VKPESAVSFVVPYGPWGGRTIGWIAKCERLDGLRWLLRQWNASRIHPDMREALRAFFACPRYAPWFSGVLGKDYPGKESFWLPAGSPGCRACGDSKTTVETLTLSCSHGIPQGLQISSSCECGYENRVTVERRVACAACSSGRDTLRLVG